MLRLLCAALLLTLFANPADAEFIYKDSKGRALALYYDWSVDPSGQTRLQVQLVNYANITWTDIVLKCEQLGSGVRGAAKEIALDAAVFDFELSKQIDDIDLGPMPAKANLACSIVKAGQGAPTLRPVRR